MPFTNPLVAGTTLIRTAIRSPNFVAGVSGWSIDKDGSAEFNDVVIRGTVIAGGGAVTLNSTGIRVVGAGNQYDINTTGGFVARKLPDTGQVFQITPETLYFRPPTPSPLGNTIDYGFIDTYRVTFSAGTIESPSIRWESPNISGKAAAAIDLRGQKSGSAFDDSAFVFQGGDFRVEADNNEPHIVGNDFSVTANNDITLDAIGDVIINSTTTDIQSGLVQVADRLVNARTGMDYSSAQFFSAIIGVGVGDTNVALGSTPYPTAFPSGTTLFGFANINSGAGATSLWYPRFLTVSNTNFNLIVSRPAAAVTATNITVSIGVFAL